MSEPFIGEIQAFPFPFAVTGFNRTWLPCGGQILQIRSFTPLFALIGTIYGGDGQQTFHLPDLRGFVTNGQGQGPGLPERFMGEMIGSPTVTLSVSEMARHTHGLQLGAGNTPNAAPGPGTGTDMMAIDPIFNGFVVPPATTTCAPNAITFTGQGQPHENRQPVQAIVWCIAYAGEFASFSD